MEIKQPGDSLGELWLLALRIMLAEFQFRIITVQGCIITFNMPPATPDGLGNADLILYPLIWFKSMEMGILPLPFLQHQPCVHQTNRFIWLVTNFLNFYHSNNDFFSFFFSLPGFYECLSKE